MEAHELVNKFKSTNEKTVESYEEIVRWCSENTEKLEVSNEDIKYLNEISMRYLMKYKIGRWTKEDAKVTINYLAKKSAKETGIEDRVTVKILDQAEYEKAYGHFSRAICVSGRNRFDVVYSQKVVDLLISGDSDEFLRGLQDVFHEVVHAKQNSKLEAKIVDKERLEVSGNTYRMALETMMREIHPQYYDENYKTLFKENQAEFVGLEQTLKTISSYNSKLLQIYDMDRMKEQLEGYAKIVYDNSKKDKIGEQESNKMNLLNYTCSEVIKAMPSYLEKFPVLQYAFNKDGSRKDILQLIEDREELINNGETLEKINDLYETIANYKEFNPSEAIDLDEYITRTGTDDEFVYELLQFRLEKTNWTEEKINEFMQSEREKAESVRQEREEKEIEHEKEETIKDEIGDQFRPKTEEEKREEQEVEVMWQSRFQAWDRNAAKLPNSAKRKEEAVNVIKDIEKEKQIDEKQQKKPEGNEQR